MKEIIIIGAGGHASVIIDVIEAMKNNGHQISIKGLLDDRKDITRFMGYTILDKIDNACLYNSYNTEYVVAIGNNKVRKDVVAKFRMLKYFTPIHPTAIIGSNVNLKSGTVVMPRAIINANTYIGSHVIINSGSIVEHDNIINDFAHISPGVTLCGGVIIGESTHIGANSTVIPCKKIGSNSIVGAGSIVVNDIVSNVLVLGTPAKIIKSL